MATSGESALPADTSTAGAALTIGRSTDPAALAARSRRENFPVAARFLPRALRRDLLAVYGFARFVDDIGDEGAASAADRLAALDAVDADLTRLYAGAAPGLPIVAALAPTMRARHLPAAPLRALVEANRVDQRVDRYPTWADVRAYCRLSAEPVGRLVLAIFDVATPARERASDAVCTALQVIEHLQDVREDHTRGRIYLPQADLASYGVAEADLTARIAGPALRRLAAAEAARAAALLDEGVGLVADLPGLARLAVAGFVGGGRAALRGLADRDYDVLGGAPPRRLGSIVTETVGVLVAARRRP